MSTIDWKVQIINCETSKTHLFQIFFWTLNFDGLPFPSQLTQDNGSPWITLHTSKESPILQQLNSVLIFECFLLGELVRSKRCVRIFMEHPVEQNSDILKRKMPYGSIWIKGLQICQSLDQSLFGNCQSGARQHFQGILFFI